MPRRSCGWISTRLPALEAKATEFLQWCCSRVRTALAIDGMRFGLRRAWRKMRKDFRRATPCSTGTRVHARAWLGVFSGEGGGAYLVVRVTMASMPHALPSPGTLAVAR